MSKADSSDLPTTAARGELTFDAILLAGGGSARMAGRNKLELLVGGVPLLERALTAATDARHVVLMGDQIARWADYHWIAEEPRGSGPAYCVAYGVRELELLSRTSSDDLSPIVLIAGDMPFAASAIPRLLTALPRHDAAVLTDDSGREQYLLAAWNRTSLLAQARDIAPHSAVRSLYENASIVRVGAKSGEAMDCDTPTALTRAREFATQQSAP